MKKKLEDLLVRLFVIAGCIVLTYFGVCYFDIVTHNLDPDGHHYPEWNILAQSIEKAGQ